MAVSDVDAPWLDVPGSHQRAHKSPTKMGSSVTPYYLLILLTSSHSALTDIYLLPRVAAAIISPQR